ncbi:hypothetical protein DPMN_152412 [Dreissena polymorpha]|uniref:Uncharacterized protein n=1 Tax=Dreissena polymorpha TaxID=45954 RepID=A0A9D4FJH1_DREPO|nr:hypothetical protein DPMN_152412 [Dreissena polymorpha]
MSRLKKTCHESLVSMHSTITAGIPAESFELSKEDLARISSLDSQHHYCWDPRGIL